MSSRTCARCKRRSGNFRRNSRAACRTGISNKLYFGRVSARKERPPEKENASESLRSRLGEALKMPGSLLQNGVFERLRRAQPNHGLRLDLDSFARLRVAAHARLAVRLHHAADAGDDEFACAALRFFHRQLE